MSELDEEQPPPQDELGEVPGEGAAFEEEDAFGSAEDFDDEQDVDEDGSVEVDEPVAPVDTSDGDDDDEPAVEPVVDIGLLEGLADDVDDDVDDEDEDDVITDGEFVCSSCHMAKRASALADADERLCRDCV